MNCWFGVAGKTFIEECNGGWYYYYENDSLDARINLYDYVRGWTFLGESA